MRLILSAFLAILSITVGAAGAQASSVTFGDSVNVWSGMKKTPESTDQDQNGVPDLTGGTLTYTNNHKLTSISLNYANHYMNTSWGKSAWKSLEAGDWYIDVDQDNAWDYLIHQPDKVLNAATHKQVSNDQYHLYALNDTVLYGDSTLYDKYGKFTQYNGYYGGTDNRDWHPSTVKDSILPSQYQVKKNGVWVTKTKNSDKGMVDLGVVGFDGWDSLEELTSMSNSEAVGSSTWDLSGLGGLDLDKFSGKEIIIAFAMTCANDVLFEHTRVPTPEPGTMLLMGLGALGVGYMRKRAKYSR
jgi:hypothetical protein